MSEELHKFLRPSVIDAARPEGEAVNFDCAYFIATEFAVLFTTIENADVNKDTVAVTGTATCASANSH